MIRVRTAWLVPGGGGGMSVHYFTGAIPTSTQATNLVTAVRDFYNAVKSYIASGVSWSWESEVAYLNHANGVIEEYTTCTPPSPVGSSGTGNYAGASGWAITWNTSVVERGRRVRGRTYGVPCNGGSLDSNGTIQSATLVAVQAAGQTLLTTAAGLNYPMVVWIRPRGEPPAGGGSALVQSCSVPDKAVVLRSRRD